jgi:hypothetical protein
MLFPPGCTRDALVARFDLPASVYRQREQYLETITDEAHLTQLLGAAVRTGSVTDFQAAIGQERRGDMAQ